MSVHNCDRHKVAEAEKSSSRAFGESPGQLSATLPDLLGKLSAFIPHRHGPSSPSHPHRHGQFLIAGPLKSRQAMASLPSPPTSRSAASTPQPEVEEGYRQEARSPPPRGPGCHRPHRPYRGMKATTALAAMAGSLLLLACPCPLAEASRVGVGGRRHATSTSAAFLGGLRPREPSSSSSSPFLFNNKHRRLDRLALRDGPSTQQRGGGRREGGEEEEEEEEESKRYATIMREMAERYE